MLDIPVQIENPPTIEHRVVVNRSNNWDLSRTVFATPIVPMEEPKREPDVRVEKDTSLVASYASIPVLKYFLKESDGIGLDKKTKYVIELHSSNNSAKQVKAEATELGRMLTKQGYKVGEIRYFMGALESKIDIKEAVGGPSYIPVRP